MSGPSSYRAEPGSTYEILWSAPDGATNLYPQAKIYNSDDTQVGSAVNLSHVSNGAYAGTATAPAKGNYYVIVVIYTDSGYTNQSSNDQVVIEPLYCGYEWRPSFGSAEATITQKQIDQIRKPLEEQLDRIEEELAKKSEFNSERDKVLTDIKPTSFRGLKEELEKKLESVLMAVKSIKFDDSGIIEAIKSKDLEIISQIDNATKSINERFDSLSAKYEDLAKYEDIEELADNGSLEEKLEEKLEEIKNYLNEKIEEIEEYPDKIIDAVRTDYSKIEKSEEDKKTAIIGSNNELGKKISNIPSEVYGMMKEGIDKIKNYLIEISKTNIKTKDLSAISSEIEKLSGKIDMSDSLTEALNIQDHNRAEEIKNNLNSLFPVLIKAIDEVKKNQPDMNVILQAREKLLTKDELDEYL